SLQASCGCDGTCQATVESLATRATRRAFVACGHLVRLDGRPGKGRSIRIWASEHQVFGYSSLCRCAEASRATSTAAIAAEFHSQGALLPWLGRHRLSFR